MAFLWAHTGTIGCVDYVIQSTDTDMIEGKANMMNAGLRALFRFRTTVST